MAVGDVSRLSVVGRFQDQNIVNTLHYKHTVQASTETDVLKELCDAWEDNVSAGWLLRHSDDYQLVGLKAFKQAGDPKVPGFLRDETFGGVADPPHSAFVSRVITLYTGSTNYRRRGRVQISGASSLMFNATDGSVTTAEVALMQVLANLLLATVILSGNEFTLCIPATTTLPLEDITAVRARNTPGVIRSRRIKGYFIG